MNNNYDKYEASLCEKRYESHKEAAQEAYDRGDHEEAAEHYEKAGRWLAEYAEVTGKDRKDRVETLYQNADTLRNDGSGDVGDIQDTAADVNGSNSSASSSNSPDQNDSQSSGESGGNDFTQMAESFITKTEVGFDDIGGLEDTKEQICHEIAMGAHPDTPDAASGADRVLLFGPPGTGKTMLAKAVAGDTETTFFDVKLGGLLSKWHGESSKRISALFNVARQMTPAVIFLDEIDALTQARGESSDNTSRRVLNTLLTELDGLNGESDGYLMVMGSTNRPMDLDEAVIRRFPSRIHVPLPDIDAAEEIVRLNTTAAGVSFAPDAVPQVVGAGHRLGSQRTEPTRAIAEVCVEKGYTGSDIVSVCQQAASKMVRRLNPELQTHARGSLSAVGDIQLETRPLSAEDVEVALEKTSASLTEASVAEYEQWNEEHGTW